MSLVRIITRLSEYPTELVRDLRTRGFEVEICLPRSEQQETADLEITLDQCSLEGMSESISRAIVSKDVVIVADSDARDGKIRSIGMVLVSSEASLETARKTVVPVQLNEIYTALLRGRLQARKFPAIFIPANWQLLWHKTVLVSSQKFSSTWKYCHAAGKNLGQLGIQTVSEAGIWIAKSRKSSVPSGKGRRSRKIEPDLVPSMFHLSGDITDSVESSAQNEEALQPAANRSIFHFWKPIAVGAVTVLTAALWLHGYSHSPLKANQVSAEDKKEMSAQSQTLIPAAQVMQKTGKYDIPPASKILAKSHLSDDDNFQEVVVRHFTQPAPRMLPKDGIKRHVVVD